MPDVRDEVVLGEITCPSGEMVLIDGGYLNLWSGDRTPLQLDAQWVDAEITGPDAAAAAQAFHRQDGAGLYDIPRHARDRYVELFRALAGRYDATLTPLADQVPHRERARRAIARGDGQFTLTGIAVVAVGDLPRDRPLPVTGVRAADGGWAGLRVRVRDAPVAGTRQLGAVGVDTARLVFGDADGLGSWRAADLAGDATGAPVLRSDQLRAVAAVRSSPHAAATLEVGGARILFASVSGGFFPVRVETGADGRTCAVVVTVERFD